MTRSSHVLLLAIIALLAAGWPSEASAATELCVSRGDTGCFATISGAVSAAHAGDVIRVAPGRYDEVLVIQRPLTLMGERGSEPWLTGRITATRAITLEHFNIVGWITTRESYAFDGVRIAATLPIQTPTPMPSRREHDPVVREPVTAAESSPDPAPYWTGQARAESRAEVPAVSMLVAPSAHASGELSMPTQVPVYGVLATVVIAMAISNTRIARSVNALRREIRRASSHGDAADLPQMLAEPRGWARLAGQVAADALEESLELDPDNALASVWTLPSPSFTVALADGRLLTFAALRTAKHGRGINLGTRTREAQAIWLSLAGRPSGESHVTLPARSTWYLVVHAAPARPRIRCRLFRLAGWGMRMRGRLRRGIRSTRASTTAMAPRRGSRAAVLKEGN